MGWPPELEDRSELDGRELVVCSCIFAGKKGIRARALLRRCFTSFSFALCVVWSQAAAAACVNHGPWELFLL
uniref:Uncharacterized protein n=1 Tax=Leersia perrieri TaxID=77586 RepID=A0A0D9VDI0_9ORYZ